MKSTDITSYQGNPNLKRKGVEEEYTEEQIREIIKCKEDPIYFIKNYIHIVNLDKGLIKFDLYKFQEELINTLHTKTRIVGKLPRQVGKCGRSSTKINVIVDDVDVETTLKELFDKF